jgi:hypothetical protein
MHNLNLRRYFGIPTNKYVSFGNKFENPQVVIFSKIFLKTEIEDEKGFNSKP